MQILGLLAAVSMPTALYEVSTHRYIGAKAVERSSVLAPTLARLEWNLPETTFAGPRLDALNADLGRVSEPWVSSPLSSPRASDVIAAGCAAEDAHDTLSPSTWRFLNHFLDGETFQGFAGGLLGAPSDVWASSQASNVFNWERALTHFISSLTDELAADREAHRVDLFRSLGQVLHLIQDAHQPSHTRDDSHSNHALVPDGYSALELWAARAVSLDGTNLDPSVAAAVRNLGGPTYRNRIVDYIRESARRTNRGFFSDDTIWQSLWIPQYPHPNGTGNGTETYEGSEGTFPFVQNYVYASPALHSTTPPLKMARESSGLRSLVDSGGDPRHFTLRSPDNEIVRGQAALLIPRAVAESAGAINHFFRLGIEADIDTTTAPGEGRLKLSNISSVPGASVADLTLAAGATVELRYETLSGRLLPLPGVVVPQPGLIPPGSTVTLPVDVSGVLQVIANPVAIPDPNVRARSDLKLVVVVEGTVGQEQAVGADLWSGCPGFPTPPGMVPIQGGTFQMGSNAASGPPYFGPVGPVHDVTISYCFWMGQHEVTQSEYAALMGTNPSSFPGANNPVEQVTWFNAQAYCAALTAQQSALGNIPPGYQYRLPTEAEWEYACRAGTTTEFNVGVALLCNHAKFYYSHHSNAYCGSFFDGPVPVGSYAPNAWGLYDMHGNVWEWCLDSYAPYSAAAVTDPFVTGGPYRVMRGGQWDGNSEVCRSALRVSSDPSYWFDNRGFRVVLAPVLVP